MRGVAFELAIRAWAKRDDMARMVVDEVDSKRLTYIAECFIAMGNQLAEAKARAFILYCYVQSESLLRNQGTPTDKSQRQQLITQMLVRPQADR